MTEGIYETRIEELLELPTLFVGEASVLAVGLRVLQVYLLVGDIEVTADDNGLFRTQIEQECTKRIFSSSPLR